MPDGIERYANTPGDQFRALMNAEGPGIAAYIHQGQVGLSFNGEPYLYLMDLQTARELAQMIVECADLAESEAR